MLAMVLLVGVYGAMPYRHRPTDPLQQRGKWFCLPRRSNAASFLPSFVQRTLHSPGPVEGPKIWTFKYIPSNGVLNGFACQVGPASFVPSFAAAVPIANTTLKRAGGRSPNFEGPVETPSKAPQWPTLLELLWLEQPSSTQRDPETNFQHGFAILGYFDSLS